jgi:hypothetical protein
MLVEQGDPHKQKSKTKKEVGSQLPCYKDQLEVDQRPIIKAKIINISGENRHSLCDLGLYKDFLGGTKIIFCIKI